MLLYVQKAVAAAWCGVLYFVSCYIASYVVERYVFSTWSDPGYDIVVLLQCMITAIAILMVMTYAIRAGVKRVPLPLIFVDGFRYTNLKELDSAVVIAFTIFFHQSRLKLWMDRVREILNKHVS